MTNFVTGNSSLSLKVLKRLKVMAKVFFGCNCDKKSRGGRRNREQPGFPTGYFLQIKFANPPQEKDLFLGVTSERVKQNSDPIFCLVE